MKGEEFFAKLMVPVTWLKSTILQRDSHWSIEGFQQSNNFEARTRANAIEIESQLQELNCLEGIAETLAFFCCNIIELTSLYKRYVLVCGV